MRRDQNEGLGEDKQYLPKDMLRQLDWQDEFFASVNAAGSL